MVHKHVGPRFLVLRKSTLSKNVGKVINYTVSHVLKCITLVAFTKKLKCYSIGKLIKYFNKLKWDILNLHWIMLFLHMMYLSIRYNT